MITAGQECRACKSSAGFGAYCMCTLSDARSLLKLFVQLHREIHVCLVEARGVRSHEQRVLREVSASAFQLACTGEAVRYRAAGTRRGASPVLMVSTGDRVIHSSPKK